MLFLTCTSTYDAHTYFYEQIEEIKKKLKHLPSEIKNYLQSDLFLKEFDKIDEETVVESISSDLIKLYKECSSIQKDDLNNKPFNNLSFCFSNLYTKRVTPYYYSSTSILVNKKAKPGNKIMYTLGEEYDDYEELPSYPGTEAIMKYKAKIEEGWRPDLDNAKSKRKINEALYNTITDYHLKQINYLFKYAFWNSFSKAIEASVESKEFKALKTITPFYFIASEHSGNVLQETGFDYLVLFKYK